MPYTLQYSVKSCQLPLLCAYSSIKTNHFGLSVHWCYFGGRWNSYSSVHLFCSFLLILAERGVWMSYVTSQPAMTHVPTMSAYVVRDVDLALIPFWWPKSSINVCHRHNIVHGQTAILYTEYCRRRVYGHGYRQEDENMGGGGAGGGLD